MGKIKKAKWVSIETELFKSITMLSVGIILILGVIFSVISYQNQLFNVNKLIKQQNKSSNLFIDDFFSASLHTIDFLSRQQIVLKKGVYSKTEKLKLLKLYQSIVYTNKNITHLHSGYEDKSLYIDNDILPGNFDPSTRPWYQSAIKNSPDASICEPYQDILSKEWLVATSKTLIDENGNILGVIGLDSNMDIIGSLLARRHDFYKSSYSYIIKENGEAIFHHDKAMVKENIFDLVQTLSPTTFSEPEGAFIYQLAGVKKLAFYSKIKKNGWIVITVINNDEVLSPLIKKSVLYMIAILLVSLLCSRMQSANLSRKIVRPLLQLKAQMKSIVSGETDKDIRWEYSDNEIAQIARQAAQLAQDELLARNIELQEKKVALEQLSNTDQLTQLNNRRKLDLELLRAKEQHARYNSDVSLLIIDIDYFKKVNDVHGHQAGDMVLTELADLLKANVRITDIPGRWGGEEFLVICPSTDIKGATTTAQKICKITGDHSFSIDTRITISIGVAQLQAGQTVDEMLQVADKNLYMAKELGRNRVINSNG